MIYSPDGIHVRPTRLGNSFHKFLSKLNSIIQRESLRYKQGCLHQHPCRRHFHSTNGRTLLNLQQNCSKGQHSHIPQEAQPFSTEAFSLSLSEF